MIQAPASMQVLYDLMVLCIFFGALFASLFVPDFVRNLKDIGSAAASLVIGIGYDIYQVVCRAITLAARKKGS